MATLIYVGEDDGLVGGVGSRGYTIQRVGNVVICKWGPIVVRRDRRFHWASRGYPRVKRHPFHSKTAAKRFVREQTYRKKTYSHYWRLSAVGGGRISRAMSGLSPD